MFDGIVEVKYEKGANNMTRVIPLTRGMVALVDEEDYEELSKYNWHYDQNGYAYRRKTCGFHESRLVSMHREIMGDIPKGKVVDHKNRVKLDNRRRNLRVTSQSNNAANSPARNGNSKYKGVHWSKNYERWVSKIEKEGKYYHLGLFDCEMNAAIAYNNKAEELYGEFSYKNEVDRKEIEWSLERPNAKTSKYVGVTKHPQTGRYRSYIRHEGKSIHLGYFGDEDMAARIRDFWTYDLIRDNNLLNIKGEVVSFG